MTRPRATRPRLTAAAAVIGACAIVWLVSDLTGAPPAQLPTARPTTTTASPTPTAPSAPAKATVSRVVDARTVLTSAGERVVVAGLAPPGPCWSATAADFTATALLGADIEIVNATPILAATLTSGDIPDAGTRAITATVLLPDGTDFAATALHQGHAKPTRDATPTHHAAATAAGAAVQGLWGQPCLGEDVLPVPVAPPVAIPTTQPKPPTQPIAPKPQNYYRNCAAARAMGTAPIPHGAPGYRPALDRDRNGIACEF